MHSFFLFSFLRTDARSPARNYKKNKNKNKKNMMQQPLFRPGQDVFPPILHECFDIRPVKASEPSTSISFQASLQAQMLSQAQLHAHAQMMNMMSQSLVHHTHSFGRTISQQTRCVRSPHPPNQPPKNNPLLLRVL